MKLKKVLFQKCVDYVNIRLHTIEKTIQSHQKALASETKSSAGDKHEIGRAMLQLEMEKFGQQLASIQGMKETLTKMNITKKPSIASLGTLVETTLGNYFLSISYGQLIVENKTYFAVSVSSPIGKLLLGNKEGDSLNFKGKEINIYKIS